jgi:hypothetical protein
MSPPREEYSCRIYSVVLLVGTWGQAEKMRLSLSAAATCVVPTTVPTGGDKTPCRRRPPIRERGSVLADAGGAIGNSGRFTGIGGGRQFLAPPFYPSLIPVVSATGGGRRAQGGYLRKFPRWAIGRRFASVTGDGGCTLWSSAVRKLKGEPTNENKTAPQTSAAFLRV